jgi:hypothetical protein
MRSFRWLLLAAALAGAYTPAHAQLPANGQWRTITSAHFRVTYEEGLESVARHAAATAERAHAALGILVVDAPTGVIDIVVADNLDISNGYASAFPSNRVVIYAEPPVDELELQYTRDWIELVVTHELAHIFHLDRSGAFGRFLRRIFGRVPVGWPVFSNYGSPRWAIEGLAVGVESAVTDYGRVLGSFNEMIVRTAALEDEMDDIDRLTSGSPEWPGPTRSYIYGSLFMDYLARRYGTAVTTRLVRSTAGAIIPPELWFGRVAKDAIGTNFREPYEEWQAELRVRYDSLAQRLTATGLTQAEPLSTHAGRAFYPRHSPDGTRIAYAAADPRKTPRTRIIDARTGAELESHARNILAPPAWAGDNTLFTTDVQFTDPFHLRSDIRDADGDRIDEGARLQEIDVAADGSVAIAVQSQRGTNRLVMVDMRTGARSVLVAADSGIHWSAPRLSPRGDRIAVGRWTLGGDYDIAVLDGNGREVMRIDAGPGVDASPAWSPDARYIAFSSDRTGIANIYAVDVSGATPGPVRQVTNVLTGAFYPDIAPDGRSLVFSAYHHNGYRIERMPFDPATWREPMPAALTGLAAARGGAHSVSAISDSIGAAAAVADTSTSAPGRYHALRHVRPYYWAPILETDGNFDDYFGLSTAGEDLVGRHAWGFSFSIAPDRGRTRGGLDYTWRGLPSIPFADVHPAISFAAHRDWDAYLEQDTDEDPYIDEREDILALGVSFTRARWRSSTSLTTSVERVRRHRYLENAPGRQLFDPEDDFTGVRASFFHAFAHVPAYAISRENGLTLQVSARRRWEHDPFTRVIEDRDVVFDASYDEITTWDAAYIALPLPGFARHVIAARFSALYRSGPGGGTSEIGGESSAGIELSIVDDLGGTSRFLPVRGFPSGERRGTRAWTASGEYRLPLAFLSQSLRPFPIYLDRLSATAFVDAGHAWCDTTLVFQSCSSTSSSDPALVGAGGELIATASIYGYHTPIRFGAGFPVRGGDDRDPRFYLVAGLSF